MTTHALDMVTGVSLQILPVDTKKAANPNSLQVDPLIAWTDKNDIGFGPGKALQPGEVIVVLNPPKKIGGVNLVQVAITRGSEVIEAWVHYGPLKVRSQRI